jgi:hypothetical protein
MSLDTLVAEYEKIGEKLEKRQTAPLRAQHDSLAKKIQQIKQAEREALQPDPSSPAPGTVSGGLTVNGE